MQNEAVDAVGGEMFEGTGQRLRNLNGERGSGIVGQAVILSAGVGEFGLQEKIVAGDDSGAVGGGESFADSGFKVVAAL